jgi:3,4-dihydroxy 2-butanone 4-phosphate synthase/GTP cyclohydrolase II
LADDPQLTVRLLPGSDPRPVVLDSHLRFPAQARLLDNPVKPWIVTHQADSAQAIPLQERGARLLSGTATPTGKLDLASTLRQLRQEGVERLMVEGGAQVLQSMLDQQLADLAVITIAPRLLGGLSALATSNAVILPRLIQPVWKPTGDDMVVWASLDWGP